MQSVCVFINVVLYSDFGIPFDATVICEVLAITSGSLAFICFLYVAYLYRIRYDNMEFDDRTERNDTITRVIALGLFSTGLVIELVVIMYYCGVHVQSLPSNANNSTHFMELLELEMKANSNSSSKEVKADDALDEEEHAGDNMNPLQPGTKVSTFTSFSKNSSKFNYSVLNNQNIENNNV